MESEEYEADMLVREFCANGVCMKATEVEAKLDEGNIQEAESSLREGLSLNFEVSLQRLCVFILAFINTYPHVLHILHCE